MESVLKLLISLFVLLSPLSLWAQEPVQEPIQPPESPAPVETPVPVESPMTPVTIKEGRSFTDLYFFPDPGVLNLSFSLGAASYEAKIYDSNGVHTLNVKRTHSHGDFVFKGGIATWLSAGLAGRIGLEQNISEDAMTKVETKEINKGFENPSFFVEARVLNFDHGSLFDLNLGVAYAPKFGTPKRGTSTEDGNLLGVADKITYKAAFYRNWGVIDGALVVTYTPKMTGTADNAGGGGSFTAIYPGVRTIDLGAQYHFEERWYGNGGILVSSMEATEGNVTKTEAATVVSIYGGGKFEIYPDEAYFFANLAVGKISDYSVNTDKVKDGMVADVNFGYMMQF